MQLVSFYLQIQSIDLGCENDFLSLTSYFSLILAAARALIDQPLDAEEIARRAMEIAADMCVYTNKNFMVETMSTEISEESNGSRTEKENE